MPRLTLPRWTQSIKFRLALTYAATVYAVGLLLIGGLYVWQVKQLERPEVTVTQGVWHNVRTGEVHQVNFQTQSLLQLLERSVDVATIESLRRASVTGLVVLVVVAFMIGWLLATITLRPINRMVAVARDITGSDLSRRIDLQGHDDELKALADTFDAMLDRLQTAFEDQRRFVQDASHELRNPLAVARTNLELALSDPRADVAELRRSAEIAHRSTGRMSALVDDLLVQARSGVPHVQLVDVDLAAVAADVRQQFLGPARERAIRISLEADRGAVVIGDELAFNRVITNLVSNALRFAPGHSTVEMKVKVCDDGMVRISVADSGPGLTDEDQQRVFTRFWRGSNAGPGSGLGLSIVKQVVERHGGTVSVTSSPGEGAVFTVEVPGSMRDLTADEATVDEEKETAGDLGHRSLQR